MDQQFEIFLVAVPGLEAALCDEARETGFAGAQGVAGGVTISGGWRDVMRANLVLRGASRVLVRIASFRAMHLAQLDKRARKVPWADFLRADVPVSVEASCRKSRIYHAGAAAQRIAKAIAGELGAPIADDAAVKIKARIEDDLCTISIDTSGEGLHKRGHKEEVAKAPEQPRREERPRTQEQPREQPRTEQKRETPKDDVLDQVAALLDKQKPSGGGAQRSTQEASLGASRTTGGEKLTQSEMDALRAQIQRCWNVPAGALDAQNLKVSLKFRLDPSGSVDGRPEVINGGGGDGVARAAAESARRAILQCAPYNLPADKYAAWADVIVHFDPSDMF
jgi:hypothetical protein